MAAASKSTSARSDASAEDIEARIANLKAEMAGLGAALSGLGAAKLQGAKSEADARLAEVAKTGEAALDDLRKTLATYERDLSRTVRERPLPALAMAAGLGFLLALIFRR